MVLNERGFFGSLLPSVGISEILRAFGFFSLSVKHRGPTDALSYGTGYATSRIGVIRRTGPWNAYRIFQDMKSIQLGSTSSFSKETLRWIFGDYREQDRCPKLSKLLKIAPGPMGERPDFSKYDKVMVLITQNTNKSLLQSALGNWETIAVLNNQVLNVISNSRDLDLTDLLGRCSDVFAPPKQVFPLEVLLRRSVLSSQNGFTDLFGGAWSANMAQLGTGLAVRLFGPGVKIAFSGVNLYADRDVYNEAAKVTQSSTEFFRCNALTGHNPVPNFTIMKKLSNEGVFEGDEQFLEVISLSIDDYLMRLDESLGRVKA